MAALAILRVLAAMLGIEVDLADLVQLAGEARERVKQVASEAMGEYIDHFTEPIWEYGREDVEEEDDGEEEENWN